MNVFLCVVVFFFFFFYTGAYLSHYAVPCARRETYYKCYYVDLLAILRIENIRTAIEPRLRSPMVARGGRAQRNSGKEIWDNDDDHHSRDIFWLRCTFTRNREL